MSSQKEFVLYSIVLLLCIIVVGLFMTVWKSQHEVKDLTLTQGQVYLIVNTELLQKRYDSLAVEYRNLQIEREALLQQAFEIQSALIQMKDRIGAQGEQENLPSSGSDL